MDDEPEVYPPCRCGREVRKLNAASDTPKCVGCGYIPEVCRCFNLPEPHPFVSVDGAMCQQPMNTAMRLVDHGPWFCGRAPEDSCHA